MFYIAYTILYSFFLGQYMKTTCLPVFYIKIHCLLNHFIRCNPRPFDCPLFSFCLKSEHSCDVDSSSEGEFCVPISSPADAASHLHPTVNAQISHHANAHLSVLYSHNQGFNDLTMIFLSFCQLTFCNDNLQTFLNRYLNILHPQTHETTFCHYNIPNQSYIQSISIFWTLDYRLSVHP